jgi:CelD/BcsL family acetyltransferase involved in cellulose biosynthesis
VDGKPAAAKYNFRYGDVEFSYQAGRDPSWRRFSIGLVILAHAIRNAVEDGMREYRFLRGGEPYKYRLATADPGLETVAVGRGPLTDAALAMSLVVGDRLSFPALRHRLAQ